MRGIMSSEADLIILGGDLNTMPNDARGKKIIIEYTYKLYCNI